MSATGEIGGDEPVPEITPVTVTWNFNVLEGWPEYSNTDEEPPFSGEVNVCRRTWTLSDCYILPESDVGDDDGCLSIYKAGSYAVSPAFAGIVTQVTSVFRPARANSQRKVSLLASTDGGASFFTVATYPLGDTKIHSYTNTTVFSTPLDGGDFGVIFCATNSGSGTVQFRRLDIEGTSTCPDEPGIDTYSPFGASVAEQPHGCLSGVVLYLSAGYGYTADADTNGWVTGCGLVNGMVEDFGNLDQLNFFALQAWKAGATVVPMRPVGYQANEVVIDNVDTDPSLASRVIYGGAWANTAQTDCYYGRAGEVGYRWTHACPTGTTAWASYRPNLPVAGEYPVYVWARPDSDRVPQLYRVHHTGGITDVRVDHRQVGNGWVWLGNYWFDAGTGGYVNISNYAPGFEDGVIIADAVRFGNGMGDISRGDAGVSGLERELEGARYWIQRMVMDSQGLSDDIYDSDGTDRDDNAFAPNRMACAMCRTNNWERWRRLYLNFQSNAADPDNDAIDAVAFHGADSDAEVLKSIRGREGLASSTLRDAVRHLATSYASDPSLTVSEVFAPDAPVAIAVTNSGFCNATVSWQMPAAENRRSDPHTGFLLYVSTDGHAFGNPVAISSTDDECSRFFANLPADITYYFRVCAINAGGESLPSPVAGVKLSDEGSVADVLVVDGFSRVDSGLTPSLRYDRIAGAGNPVSGNVALVRPKMINSFDYVKEHGSAIALAGYSFDFMNASLVNASVLARYPKVVWCLGEESMADETFSYDEQQLIAKFLANGGALCVSGSDIGWDLGEKGSPSDKAFLENCLHCTYVSDDSGSGIASGKTATYFKELSLPFNYTNNLANIYAAERPDILAPVGDAFVAGVYDGVPNDQGSIITFSNRVCRTVVMGFPFETVTDETQRNRLMKRVLNFFDENMISPLWIGNAAYTVGVGGKIEIDLKSQVSGFPSPFIRLVNTHDSRTSEPIDETTYTATSDYFSFVAPDVGTFVFKIRAENGAGYIEQEVAITAGESPVWRSVGEILVDLDACVVTNVYSLVSGCDPAVALDEDNTFADPSTYSFNEATGDLEFNSSYPVTNVVAFVASNSSGSDSISITNVIRRLDTDGDGIPDWWAAQYFGGPTRCNPNLDSDSDNFTNYQEFLAGTDPTESSSLLALGMDISSDGIRLSWPSAAGRVYSVWTTPALTNDFSLVEGNIEADPPLNLYTIPKDENAEEQSSAFFRLSVTYPGH